MTDSRSAPGAEGLQQSEPSAGIPDVPPSSRTLRWVVGLAVVAAFGIWLVVASMLRLHSEEFRHGVATRLVETNESVAEFAVGWVEEHRTMLEVLGAQAPMSDRVRTLVSADPNGLAYEAAAESLIDALAPLVEIPERVIVATADGRVAFAPGGASGTVDLALEALIGGEDGPGISVLPLEPDNQLGDGALPSTARVWAPIDSRHDILGWIGVEVDVTPLVRLLDTAAGATETREVYFFDRQGRMLTPSRFEGQLREIGLIGSKQSSIGMRLADPGGAPETPGRGADGVIGPAGLTRSVSSAASGESGVDVTGYRDYRGVEVVGAWKWIDELGVGIATEVDREEAYAPFERTSSIWSIAAAVLIAFVLLLSAIFIVVDHRLRRVSRRLVHLTTNLDEEVRTRTADLEASQERLRAEVAARTELMAAVSHELRTPLTSVVGFASLLAEQDEQLDPSLRVFVQLLVQESADMSDLVEDLLTSVRASTGSLDVREETVDLQAEVRSMVAAWNPGERARIRLEGGTARGWGDPLRVRQVVRNLLANAVRYGGPEITVTTAEDEWGPVLVVADDGPCIADEVSDHMFEPYVRHATHDGLAPSIGMGLTLCRRLCDAMGGSIRFERRGEHNRFVVRLLPASVDATLLPGRDVA